MPFINGMQVNKKLNNVPLSINEIRVGNILKFHSNPYVVTGIDGNTQKIQIETFEHVGLFKKETIYKEHIVSIHEVEGLAMWDKNDSDLFDKVIKQFGFFAVERYVYKLVVNDIFTITAIDKFNIDDNGGLHISAGENTTVCTKIFWYLHEIQNAVFATTDFEIANDLMKSVIIDKPQQTKSNLLEN